LTCGEKKVRQDFDRLFNFFAATLDARAVAGERNEAHGF